MLYVLMLLLVSSLSFSSDAGEAVLKFYRMLLKGEGVCLEIVKEHLGVKLIRDVFVPVSKEQAQHLCKNIKSVRTRFPKVKYISLIDERVSGNRAYVTLKLQHPHPAAYTEVTQFVVKMGKRWRLVF